MTKKSSPPSPKKKTEKKNFFSAQNILIFLLLVFLGIFLALDEYTPTETTDPTPKPLKKEKMADVVVFGEFQPDKKRAVLARIESPADMDILAEASGTVEFFDLTLGDHVEKGDVLLRLSQNANAGAIAYNNALSALQVTKLTAQNNIRTAEVALENARIDLEQIQNAETQNQKRNIETLFTTTKNVENILFNALNWADDILGATHRYENRLDRTKRYIGNNNQIQRQATKVSVQNLVREYDTLTSVDDPHDIQTGLRLAQERKKLLEKTRTAVMELNDMIRRTNTAQHFTETNRATFQAQAEGYMSQINAEMTHLSQAIEGSKSESNRVDSSVVSAFNRVKNAEAALDVTKAQAQAQIQNAENHVSSSEVVQKDLTLTAPFRGTVTKKYISQYQQISPGMPVISLLSDSVSPKVVAAVTFDEWERLQLHDTIDIQLPNKEILSLSQMSVSAKIDPVSQKVQVEFPLETLPEDLFVGSFVKLLVPLKNGHNNLLPITALSFEPGGAEVLVVKNGTAQRRRITYTQILSDSVVVSSGLEKGEQVLRYRKRFYDGDLIRVRPSEKGDAFDNTSSLY